MSLLSSWLVGTSKGHANSTCWRRAFSATSALKVAASPAPKPVASEPAGTVLKPAPTTGSPDIMSSSEEPDKKKNELQPLNRPLGVRERPTTIIKTRTEKMKELMDKEKRLEQRRHLIKEAGKGYFHDMNMTRKHGGKTWIAPKVLIREDKALYLPNIAGKSLGDGEKKNTTTMCYGKITVLAMLGTKISELHAKGFIDPTHARYSSNPHYQYIQINLQENLLKSFLVNLFSNTLRGTVPPELQANYLVSSQNMEYVRQPLGMTNSKVGYVYLIDESLRIRWGGCADATVEETQALEACTGVLLARLEKGKKTPATQAQSGDAASGQGIPPSSSTS